MAAPTASSDWTTPIVDGVGPAIHFPDAAFQLDPSITYRAVFDVTRAGEGGEVPAGLSQMARLINSFALHGADPSALDLVGVVHGPATAAALSDDAHQAHVGGANPSRDLLARLREVDARLYVCGNALVGSGYAVEELGPDVELATSALAVLATLQGQGYALMSY